MGNLCILVFMKPNVAFFKSEEFIAWIAINAVFPIFMIGLIRLTDIAMTMNLSMFGKQIFAVFSIIIILLANIHCAKRWRHTPAFKYFVGIIFLNIISVFVAGDISFISSFASLHMYSDTFMLYYGILTEAH